MGSIAALFMYLMIIGFIAVVAYFVIKKAIKDALKEYNNENNKCNYNLYDKTLFDIFYQYLFCTEIARVSIKIY